MYVYCGHLLCTCKYIRIQYIYLENMYITIYLIYKHNIYFLKYVTLSVKTQLKSFFCDLLISKKKNIFNMVKNIM